MLMMLGRMNPWSWPDLGLLSVFALWLTLLVQAFWCITCRLLSISIERTNSHGTPSRFGWSSCWLLLWLEAVVVAMLMIQLLLLIDRGAALGLIRQDHDAGRVILVTGIVAALLAGVLLRYTAIWQRWQIHTQQQARMELQNLQARLRPHFLYNTLNTIAALITPKPATAVDAIEDLSDLLRQSLQPRSRLVALEQELTLCRQYLQLMQLRLADRLQTEWRIDSELENQLEHWKIPPLTIQALVENAILHGIQPIPHGGLLDIHLSAQNQRLQVNISNPLPNSSERSTMQPNAGTGTALNDLRKRLDLVYNNRASLHNHTDEQRYYVTLELPHE